MRTPAVLLGLRRFVQRVKLGYAVRRSPLKIVLGSGGICQPGWIPTDIEILNVLKPDHWARLLRAGSVDALLAEHVWEHLSLDEGAQAARTCLRYLKDGGHLRIAVPDGNHPFPAYIDAVRPGGIGAGAKDHKVLYDYRSLSGLLEAAGFEVRLLEYFDEHGGFHACDMSEADGLVRRAWRTDPRNAGSERRYTSLIIDAVKPRSAGGDVAQSANSGGE
jgi:predicted SAM-dependent methyltransferase